mmetsp:Transcript_14381/g.21167  ORF Transcript_14381/g.21167 Transcript_14381/m.21167 type:complete len:232 (-) Transcript_14381:115-810(-)
MGKSVLPADGRLSDNNKSIDDEAKSDLQAKIVMGRSRESTIELKAQTADSLAVLVAFLVAFLIDNILNMDESQTGTFTLLLTLSVSSGLFCVVVFTFLSAKIRRLLARGVYRFGSSDCSIDDLLKIYGHEKLLKLVNDCTFGQDKSGDTIRFFARQFYDTNKGHKIRGRTLFQTGMLSFTVTIAGFLCALCAKLIDALDITFASICVLVCMCTLGAAATLVKTSGAAHELD